MERISIDLTLLHCIKVVLQRKTKLVTHTEREREREREREERRVIACEGEGHGNMVKWEF